MTNENEHGRLTELSESECYELLGTTTVGRVAFVDEEGQKLVPVNFRLVDGLLYFRTGQDTVLARLAQGMADVAFGVDYHDDTYRSGWNVTVNGPTGTPAGDTSVTDASSLGSPRPWAPGPREVVIELRPHTISGRRVRRG